MTSRERLLCVLRGDIPDCVPVCLDISNMIPARLTGKPFWDIYVYKNPPLWKAYIDAIKRFDIDGGFELYQFGDLFGDLGQEWIDKIVLKGNLHTIEVMLRGSVDDVISASKKAIDDAAKGGRFILSTGDQCGRDTPDKNLRAMVETARTYDRY